MLRQNFAKGRKHEKKTKNVPAFHLAVPFCVGVTEPLPLAECRMRVVAASPSAAYRARWMSAPNQSTPPLRSILAAAEKQTIYWLTDATSTEPYNYDKHAQYWASNFFKSSKSSYVVAKPISRQVVSGTPCKICEVEPLLSGTNFLK